MKKAIIAFLIFFAYAALLTVTLPKQLPDTRRIIEDIEADQEGNYLLAENKEYVNLIYAADYEGNIVDICCKSNRRGQQRGRIYGIESAEDGRIYYLELWDRSGMKIMEIYRLRENWDGEELVGTLDCPQELTVGSFNVKEGQIFLSLVDKDNGYVRAYSTSADTDTMVLEERFEKLQRDVDVVVNSAYDGRLLYTLSGGGGVSYYTEESARSFEVIPDGKVCWMSGVPDGILYGGSEGGVYYHKGQEELQVSEISGDSVIDADITRNMEHTAILTRDSDYVMAVHGENGRSYPLERNFRVSALVVKRLLLRPALMLSGIFLFGALLLAAALYIVKKQHRIAVNVVVCMAAANVAFVAGLTVFLHQNTWLLMEKSRQISNTVFNYGILEQLYQAADLEAADWKRYAGTKQFELMGGCLYDMWIQDDPEDPESQVRFKPMLVWYDGEDAYIVNSWSDAYGRRLWNVLEREVLEGMEALRGENGYITVIPENFAELRGYTVTTGFTGNENIFMVSEASMRDLDMRCGRILVLSVRRACIYGGIVLIVMGILLAVMLRPVKQVSRSMEKVAAGIYELPEVKLPDNEFGAMWVYLHKMCKALKVQEYSRDNVLNYYYKFVPKGFERLFGKERLQEVGPGEDRPVPAAVCILSLDGGDRLTEIREGAGPGNRNRLIRLLGECADRQEGILLTDTENLKSARAVFGEENGGTVKAAAFGLESLREFESLREGGYSLKPSVLLHTGELVCGLAGTEERLYPYAVSRDLEVLRPYTDFLRELGVKMAVTGEAAVRLSGIYTLRLIGYIKTPEENSSFKIYEVLDACAKQERERKQELAGSFAEGLKLFYQDEFYRARGCFAGILKQCPEDYAARWYLFRCEALFERQVQERTDHSLFRQDGGL